MHHHLQIVGPLQGKARRAEEETSRQCFAVDDATATHCLVGLTHERCNQAGFQAPVHNVQFVKYDVTVSFMAQVLDTVTYLVPQVLDTAS